MYEEVRETEGYRNPVYVGITEEQKAMILDLRKVNNSDAAHCREALEKSDWNPAKAWTYLRIRGW